MVVDDKTFSSFIYGLDPETTYHVRAFISLGEFDDEEFYIYGSVQRFKTEKVGSGE